MSIVRRVLIVDDESAVLQTLSILLKSRGFDVLTATTGEETLDTLNSKEVDLILLDIVLPDIDGFDVCHQIKSNPKTKHIPVIIVSSRYANEDKLEGFHLGADDYISKPFENEELFARVEAVLRRSGFDNQQEQERHKSIVIKELRNILENELIVPYYQPIYLLKPFCVLGFEVLARPRTETVLVSPEVLFKAALKYDLYYQLEMLSWKIGINNIKDKINQEQLFFNCNPYLVEHERFDLAKNIFENGGLSLENIVLELTERSAITEFKKFYEQLQVLRAQGFRFAVDDVGGGYASLESIVETKPEIVKIDRHIISNLHEDPVKRSIVRFIVSFCQENNIVSIAEGIEHKEELIVVKELGIDAAQGYYLYRPTPNPNFKDLKPKWCK